MNEIIKISYDSEQPTVLGRDLHEALEVETPYHKWFPRMCEYGFEEKKRLLDIFVRKYRRQTKHQSSTHNPNGKRNMYASTLRKGQDVQTVLYKH